MGMPHLVRAAGVLLIGLSGWAYVSGELQVALSAVKVSCTEEDGVLKVALLGKAQGRASKASYVLLSRPLLGAPGAELRDERPCLELGGPRWSVHGGIREACLTPQELRAGAAEALA